MAYHDDDLVRTFSHMLTDTTEFPDATFDAIELETVRPLMNVKLAQHFTVDLTSVPEVITTIASMFVAGYALRARLSSEKPNTSTIAQALIDDAQRRFDEVMMTPEVLGLDFKTVTDIDQQRNRVRYYSPRKEASFGYPASEMVGQDDPNRGR